MAARYQYFGVLRDGGTVENLAAVFRSWTAPDGLRHEEVFTRNLMWEPSHWLSSMARPGFYDDDHVAIDEPVAMRFIEHIRDLHGDGQPLETLLEARPVVPVRDRKVSPREAVALIRKARRPADAAWRDYVYDETDTLYAAHEEADDDGRLHLRDAAEQLLLGRGDDCPIGAVNVLGWSPWGFREPERLDRFVHHYVTHGPLQQLGRVLWKQSSWVGPVQVKALEVAAAGDPMRHLPVCAVVLKHSHYATGTLWEALAAILRTSTDPATLARLHDVVEQAGNAASYNDVIRSRNLPRALLEAVGARTRSGSALFLAGFGGDVARVAAVNDQHGEPGQQPDATPAGQPPFPGARFGEPWPASAGRGPSRPPRSPRTAWGTFKLLFSAAIVLAFVGGVFYTHVIDPDRDDAGNVRGDRTISFKDVRVGDCTNLNTLIGQENGIEATPCTSAHNAEVIARYTMPGGDWPGQDAVDKSAKTECPRRLQAYAGAVDVETVFATPTSLTWNRDRDVVCFAYRSGGGLTGSLRR